MEFLDVFDLSMHAIFGGDPGLFTCSLVTLAFALFDAILHVVPLLHPAIISTSVALRVPISNALMNYQMHCLGLIRHCIRSILILLKFYFSIPHELPLLRIADATA